MKLPPHYTSLMPYAVVSSADEFIEFIQKVFNAEEKFITRDDAGLVRHAEFAINGSTIMFGQGSEMWKPIPTNVFAVLENVDEVHAKAVDAGSETLQEPGEYGYGQASGFRDPFGNTWWLNRPAGEHVE